MDTLIELANQLYSIAQNGLTFCEDPFDIERYHQIQHISTTILAEKSNFSREKIADLFSKEFGYATPKLDVRGAVFKEDKILLVQERSDGKWTLPGGWADVHTSPSEAVCKEIREESGFKTKAVKLFAVYDKAKQGHPTQLPHVHKMFFICELLGGKAETSIETSAVDFFAQKHLPELSLERVLPSQIERAFLHRANMGLPTDFD